jgi:hypothetical protein
MEHLFLDPSPEKWRAINRISSIAKVIQCLDYPLESDFFSYL